ncbi:tyrosine-type recombinase/integrase [Vibrio sp. 10N.247.311.64]|uniref:site-specific integrase n=1 Tax=Vibrio sp. 10N.247.311.64 TaxID=3229997 RepID=UPI00355361D7
MKIERFLVSYTFEERNLRHNVLILKSHNGTEILLSAVNLYLKDRAFRSIKTSERYSSAIKRFLEFVISKGNCADSTFWRNVRNRDIREWQNSIVKKRDSEMKKRPNDETIFQDASIVFDFYSWAQKNNFPTLTNITSSSWKYIYRDESKLLSTINVFAGERPDYSNIDIGIKRGHMSRCSRKNQQVTIMSTQDIQRLIKAYNDPVYPAMLMLALATGMREQGVCSFPYIGIGNNDHIRSYPEILNNLPQGKQNGGEPKTFPFTVLEKGNKTRTLEVNISAWKVICASYLPFYYERRKIFQNKNSGNRPDNTFFLNKAGIPVTPKMISDRTYSAKKKLNDKNFRWSFHNTRDWYATSFIIKHLTTEQINTSHYDAAIEGALRRQLGHEDIRTTYMHYVRVASLLLATQSGKLDFSLGKNEKFWNEINR